jgi:hypothetical protein
MLSSSETYKFAEQIVSRYLSEYLSPYLEINFTLGCINVKRYLISERKMLIVYGIKF